MGKVKIFSENNIEELENKINNFLKGNIHLTDIKFNSLTEGKYPRYCVLLIYGLDK